MTDTDQSEPPASPLDRLLAGARQEYQEAGSQRWQQPAPGESAGDRIDRYHLLEKIGEGGMGTVWKVRQLEPVERIVALKVIKLGMDTREVVGRFEAERQALAMMEHPHIAKVLDGGATESGRPYFVMELVQGEAITRYCARNDLALTERLELFMRVCEAIQHAHHKGVIHRDIKPSNVLVATHDGVAVPKVIDFGIAKATGAELAQRTLFTKYAQVIGTPEYMAPEQAEQSDLDIDTRADVYSLGVLLYELLTGCLPFDSGTGSRSNLTELMRTIREVDPVKPSTRVSTRPKLGSAAPRSGSADSDRLSRQLRGDLDWIVLKALEKDRSRRYATASGLAADVGRYLAKEPVLAAPPSTSYRLRKFVERRRRTVVSAALFLLLATAGSVGTGVGWWRTARANHDLDVALEEKSVALASETKERERALDAESQAQSESERAGVAEQEAHQRAAELEQVAAFQAEQLGRLNIEEMGVRLQASLQEAASVERREDLAAGLAGVNFSSISLRLLQESLFDKTLASIDLQFEDQPLVRAKLLQSVGETMTRHGLFDAALAPHGRALALRREHLGSDHPDTVNMLQLIGVAYLNLRRPAEAEPYIREALERTEHVLGDDDPSVLLALNNLGGVLFSLGKLVEAEPYYERALAGRRRVLGEDHRSTLRSMKTMGSLLVLQGKLEQAEHHFREAYAGQERTQGERHRDTLNTAASLGSVLLRQSKLEDAEVWLRRSIEGNLSVLGEHHDVVLESQRNLGTALRLLGRTDEAEPYLQQALDGFEQLGRLEYSGAVQTMTELELLLREVIEAERGAEDQVALRAHLGELGAVLLLLGEPGEAEAVLADALAVPLDGEPGSDWRAAIIRGDLGAALAAQGKRDTAETHLVEGAEALLSEDAFPEAERALANAQVEPACLRLATFYDAWHALDASLGCDQKAATWRQRLALWNTELGG